MAFDACFLGAVLRDMEEKLTGSRVEKIHQPSRDTVLLHLKSEQGRHKLLLGISPANPRLYLTQSSPENPAQPPMFCMFLRKHLLGGRLLAIRQMPMERVAEFTFSCISELGDVVQRRLVAELMGRTCNLYLLDENNRILDCLRRIGMDETAKRPALPGLYYQSPDPVDKLDPRAMGESDWESLLSDPGADLLAQRLMDCLGGLSALVCREAALDAAGDVDARMDSLPGDAAQRLHRFFAAHLQNPAPYYYADSRGDWKQFAFCPIRQYGQCMQAASFTELLDGFYVVKDRKDAMHQKSQAVRKTVSNLCQRISRKLGLQEKELAQSLDRERLRQLGDIVTANLHRIQKGQKLLQAEDFYDEEMKVIDIPLSVTLSPQQNAAKFYKDYTRMKNAERELKHQLEVGRTELSYLQSVLEELNRASTEADLEEIRSELRQGGYLRREPEKRMKAQKSQPMRFESTDGYPIYVGKNNRQNEELTFRLARKDDLWLHAQKVHGSHVIIACAGKQPPDNTITQAAQLAAYYAESTDGQNIAVDVTPVKQVKKTPAGKPGMVIYHTYRTVIVNPYPDIVIDPLNGE